MLSEIFERHPPPWWLNTDETEEYRATYAVMCDGGEVINDGRTDWLWEDYLGAGHLPDPRDDLKNVVRGMAWHLGRTWQFGNWADPLALWLSCREPAYKRRVVEAAALSFPGIRFDVASDSDFIITIRMSLDESDPRPNFANTELPAS